MIIDKIISWAIPVLCGGALGALTACITFIVAIKNGVQCLLRAEIIRDHEKYMARGSCPIYARESLRREYSAYHKLGGNDVATHLYNEILDLPTDGKPMEQLTHGGGDNRKTN